MSEHNIHFIVTAGMAHTTCQKRIWFIVCRWVSVWPQNIKGSTHADMKTILLDDTEKPVRGVQSLSRCYWLWRKVNYGFPGVALYQHVQPVNKVGREQIQVSVWVLMKNTRAPALISADVWAPQSGLICQQVWAHAFPAQTQRMCQVFCLKVRNFKSSRQCWSSLTGLWSMTHYWGSDLKNGMHCVHVLVRKTQQCT